jgi:hypothetical protein
MTADVLDRLVVQCNYATATGVAAAGARAYLTRDNPGGYHDRVMILVRSRGGRWVEKWESIARLGEFRVKVIPPDHPRWTDARLWTGADPHAMAALLSEAKAAHDGKGETP